MDFVENTPLAPRTTLGVGGPARFYTVARREDDIPEAVVWARRAGLPLLVLGGGSNLLVADRGFPGLVLDLQIRSASWSDGCLTAGAGEDWDHLVAQSVAHGWAGIECLSGIPGRVGATPVQNVGAYGQDVSETLSSVRAWDLERGDWHEFDNAACGFAYRASRFNGTDAGRFIITGVKFQLRPGAPGTVQYPELRRRLAAPLEPAPTLDTIRAAVLAIRGEKSMVLSPADPESRGAGSFFKNPVIAISRLPQVEAAAGAAPPTFPAGEGKVKLSAAWLLEQSGLRKGFSLGPAALSRHHVLAIVNRGGASAADIVTLARHVRDQVEAKFGIRLDPEPVPVGFNSATAGFPQL